MKKIFTLFCFIFIAKMGLTQNQIINSTARQSGQIDSIFPFDIALRRPDSSVVLSSKLLKKGRPTVLAFWLTTCYPCRIEFDEYLKNWTAWKSQADFDFFAISTDFPRNWSAFVERSKAYPWPILLDGNREFSQILEGNLNGLPQVFLFDKTGKLVFHHKRFMLGDEAELFSEIKKAAAQ